MILPMAGRSSGATAVSYTHLFVTMMAFVMAIMGWAIYTDPQDAPPLPLLVVMFGIPAGCIVAVSYTHLGSPAVRTGSRCQDHEAEVRPPRCQPACDRL